MTINYRTMIFENCALDRIRKKVGEVIFKKEKKL